MSDSNNTTNYVQNIARTIRIFDTTLRDGEQGAYCTMYTSEKIEIAKQLEKINVDVIEAGFAVSSKENFETMQKVSRAVKKPYLCGLARGIKGDIDATYQAYKDYEKRMIHIFVPVSKAIAAKLKKSDDELVRMAAFSVNYAKKYFDTVEFTPEDAARADFEMLEKVCRAVLNEGVSIIDIADTVSCAYPNKFGKLIARTKDFARSINPDVIIGVHCHNDLGLALANSLSAIENGAEQVECTINGIGERAGNCALEQIIAWSIARPDFFTTNANPKEIYKASELVAKATGTRNDFAPVVGKAVFSHKAGIHQHGITNNKNSYEFLDAEKFGRKSELVVGPHSGYHGVMAKASELGFSITKEEAYEVIAQVSELVRKKVQKRFSDDDLIKILQNMRETGFEPV